MSVWLAQLVKALAAPLDVRSVCMQKVQVQPRSRQARLQIVSTAHICRHSALYIAKLMKSHMRFLSENNKH